MYYNVFLPIFIGEDKLFDRIPVIIYSLINVVSFGRVKKSHVFVEY